MTEAGEIIRKNVERGCYTWSLVPDRLKREQFIELQKQFYVPESRYDQLYRVFENVGAKCYQNAVYRWKKFKISGRPPGISEEDWLDWLAYWQREDVEERARKNRKNRYTEVNGEGSGISKYFGGSQAIAVTMRKALCEEDGNPMALYDAFTGNKKNGDEWRDTKAQKIGVEMDAWLASQSMDLTLEEKNEAFLRINKKNKKQRICGIGSVGDIVGSCSTGRSHRTSSGYSQEHVQSAVQEAIVPLHAEIDAGKEKHRQLESHLEAITALLHQHGLPPLHPPPPE